MMDSASVGGKKRKYQLNDHVVLPLLRDFLMDGVDVFLMRMTYLPQLCNVGPVVLVAQQFDLLPSQELAMTLLALCGAGLRTQLL